jgi:hypothetical protein
MGWSTGGCKWIGVLEDVNGLAYRKYTIAKEEY